MVRLFGTLALLAAATLPNPALACRLALALGLDVSGSVDDREYDLQMTGLAAAFGDPGVQEALFDIPDAPVAVAVYEWSSSRYQRIVQDWMLINSPEALDRLRSRLMSWVRGKAPEATGLGAAMEYGKVLLDRAPVCWNRTLYVSGDGKNNDWPDPRLARASGTVSGIRINALVIARDAGGKGGLTPLGAAELSAYFRARVIQGPDAFVEVAIGFEDYAEAMRKKLLKELRAQPIGALPFGAEGLVVPVAGAAQDQ